VRETERGFAFNKRAIRLNAAENLTNRAEISGRPLKMVKLDRQGGPKNGGS